MSMLSAMCDRLRERAKELRNLAPDPDVPYLVPSTKETMALTMKSAASEMEGAADTIWELRDDLQRTNAENAKLRELAENLLMAFMVLETPQEQQKCIDRAIELRHELNVLPMETFDACELGIEV